jgi:hypothetical protein
VWQGQYGNPCTHPEQHTNGLLVCRREGCAATSHPVCSMKISIDPVTYTSHTSCNVLKAHSNCFTKYLHHFATHPFQCTSPSAAHICPLCCSPSLLPLLLLLQAMPINDGWLRDWGPTCIARPDPVTGKRQVAGVHWDYDCCEWPTTQPHRRLLLEFGCHLWYRHPAHQGQCLHLIAVSCCTQVAVVAHLRSILCSSVLLHHAGSAP